MFSSFLSARSLGSRGRGAGKPLLLLSPFGWIGGRPDSWQSLWGLISCLSLSLLDFTEGVGTSQAVIEAALPAKAV